MGTPMRTPDCAVSAFSAFVEGDCFSVTQQPHVDGEVSKVYTFLTARGKSLATLDLIFGGCDPEAVDSLLKATLLVALGKESRTHGHLGVQELMEEYLGTGVSEAHLPF